jgi:hypothetical protein
MLVIGFIEIFHNAPFGATKFFTRVEKAKTVFGVHIGTQVMQLHLFGSAASISLLAFSLPLLGAARLLP